MREALVWIVIAAMVMASRAYAAEEKLVEASLLADVDAVAPGKSFTLGLRLKMKEHWHTYWLNPGESGEPTQIKFTAPEGFEFGAIQWPLPSKINTNGAITYGYENQVLLLIPVTVSKSASIGGKAEIQAAASWLSCHDDLCVEGEAKLAITLPINDQAKSASEELFTAWRQRLPVELDAGQAATQQMAGVDELTVTWVNPPRSVDWYPVSTAAVLIEQVAVEHYQAQTRIRFIPKVFKPEGVSEGRVDGLLVYEDEQGRRRGIWTPIRIKLVKGD